MVFFVVFYWTVFHILFRLERHFSSFIETSLRNVFWKHITLYFWRYSTLPYFGHILLHRHEEPSQDPKIKVIQRPLFFPGWNRSFHQPHYRIKHPQMSTLIVSSKRVAIFFVLNFYSKVQLRYLIAEVAGMRCSLAIFSIISYTCMRKSSILSS
jgi:hypothetical protein